MDVQPIVRQVHVAHRDHRHRRKGFIDLIEIGIPGRPARPFQRLAHREDRCGGEAGRGMGVRGMGYDARDRREAQAIGDTGPRHDQRGGPVRDRRGVGRRDRAVLGESGLQRRDFRRIALGGLFVLGDHGRALARLDRDGHDLSVERARALRGLGALQRGDGEIILRLPCELILLRRLLGEMAHQPPALIGVLQPVEEHMVVERIMADARAAAMLVAEIGRIRHALHAARDDQFGRTRRQRLGGHDRGLHPRTAHFVDGGRLDMLAEAREDRRLPRGCLPQAGGQDAAHMDTLDRGRRDARALDRGLDGGRAQLRRGHVRQAALERSHGGAGIGQDDDGVRHGILSDRSVLMSLFGAGLTPFAWGAQRG